MEEVDRREKIMKEKGVITGRKKLKRYITTKCIVGS